MINTDRERRDFIVPVMYSLIVYSLAVHLIVGLCGYYVRPANLLDPESYRGFLQKPNWSLYPFYFTISLYALRLSWSPFLSVWKKLVATKVISIKSNSTEDDVSRALVQYVGSWRWLCIASAIAVSLLFNYFAFKEDVWNMYTAKSVKEQMKIACSKPDLFSKWFFFGDKKNQEVCIRNVCEPYVAKN